MFCPWTARVFSAIYRHPEITGLKPRPMKHIAIGSRVNVSGICFFVLENSKPYDHEAPFNILMRSPDDITVVSGPPLLSVANLLILVGLLLAVVVAVGARGWYIERKMRSKTAELAYIETAAQPHPGRYQRLSSPGGDHRAYH